MKMTVNERACEEQQARLEQHKKKRKQQMFVIAAELLLLCVAVLGFIGIRYVQGTMQDIRIDPNADPFSYYDPGETEPEPLPMLTEETASAGTDAETTSFPSSDDTEAFQLPEIVFPSVNEPEWEPVDPAVDRYAKSFVNPLPDRTADPGSFETYVIFGVDTRQQKELLKYTMGDVCILVSVNKETGDVRMVSVYRDFCVEGEHGLFFKLTDAYMKYGASEAVAILNRNLDLQIKDYIVVGWTALADIVDIMGGLEINMSRAEAEQVNYYIEETRQATGRPKGTRGVQVREGVQRLNGVSVVCYSRIRYFVGNDVERTRRQRYVIGQLLDKVKDMNIGQMLEVVESLRKNVKTTLEANEILALAYNYQKYSITVARSFPEDLVTDEDLGWVFYSKDLCKDVTELHQLLYNDFDYTPPDNITRIGEYHKGRISGSLP